MNCTLCDLRLPPNAVYCPRCASPVEGAIERKDYSYEAFISYRHTLEDVKLARRIQRRIEGYRIPKELRVDGKHRLGKCFRDEDELPTSDSLPHLIEDALDRSRFLIVVCSPSARESRWVSQEVELFSAFHGRNRVLLALAEGEPADAFPTLLMSLVELVDGEVVEREAEPVAADMRRSSKKRFSAEVLRLLAPIVRCDYDALRQRERVRLLRSISVVAGSVAVTAAAFGAFALSQQARIQANYEQALRTQSEYLAGESVTLLDAGHRMESIQVSLFALGKGQGEDQDLRPYVPSARNALEDACQIYPGTYWRPLYSNQERDTVTKALVSPDHSLYAVALADSSVNVYDVATGRLVGSVEPPANSTYRYDVALTDKGVLCLDTTFTTNSLTLYDAHTCEQIWTRVFTWQADELVTSPDGLLVSTISDGSTIDEAPTVAVLSAADGSTVVEAERFPPVEGGNYGSELFVPQDPAVFSENGDTFVQAIDDTLWVLDVASGAWRSFSPEVGHITSLLAHDSIIYLGSLDKKDEGGESVVSSFELSTLNQKWSYRTPATGSALEPFSPRLFQVGNAELGQGLLAGVGVHLFVLNAETGEVDLDLSCPAAVDTARLLEGGSLVYVSDGRLFSSTRTRTLYLSTGYALVGAGRSAPTLLSGGEPEPGLSGEVIFDEPGGGVLCLLSDEKRTAIYRYDLLFDLPGRESLSERASSALSGGSMFRSAHGTYLFSRELERETLHVLDGETFELMRSIDLDQKAPSATTVIRRIATSPTEDDIVYLSWNEYSEGGSSHDVLCALDASTGEVVGTNEVESISSDIEKVRDTLHLVIRTNVGYSLVTLDARTLDTRSETLLQIDNSYHSIDDVGTLQDSNGDASAFLLVIDEKIVAFDPETGSQIELPLSGLEPEATNLASSAQASMILEGYSTNFERSARLVFNDDRTRLLVTDANGTISLFGSSGAAVWKIPGTSLNRVSLLMFLPSGEILAQGGSTESSTGQFMLIDGQTGATLATSEVASRVGGAWLSQDGTALFATSMSYGIASLSASFVDGISIVNLDPQAFGVESTIYLADAVSSDERRVLLYNQSANEYFTLPRWSTEDLIDRANELVEGHELTEAERRLYHLE